MDTQFEVSNRLEFVDPLRLDDLDVHLNRSFALLSGTIAKT